jgi:hypothetical protein
MRLRNFGVLLAMMSSVAASEAVDGEQGTQRQTAVVATAPTYTLRDGIQREGVDTPARGYRDSAVSSLLRGLRVDGLGDGVMKASDPTLSAQLALGLGREDLGASSLFRILETSSSRFDLREFSSRLTEALSAGRLEDRYKDFKFPNHTFELPKLDLSTLVEPIPSVGVPSGHSVGYTGFYGSPVQQTDFGALSYGFVPPVSFFPVLPPPLPTFPLFCPFCPCSSPLLPAFFMPGF